jgi:hypothetical protein
LSFVPAQNIAIKAVVTPLLIGGASLTGRRFGHHVGGWLVALPMTSGPVAFFLATDHGVSFASRAAVGMLAGTISQVAFALAYTSRAVRGAGRAFLAGATAFAVMTVALSSVQWPAPETFMLVLASLVLGYVAMKRRAPAPLREPVRLPRWDIPVRMAAATTVVCSSRPQPRSSGRTSPACSRHSPSSAQCSRSSRTARMGSAAQHKRSTDSSSA